MTSISDVVRQVEAAMSDPSYPPTSEEREVLAAVLSRVHAGSAPGEYSGTVPDLTAGTVEYGKSR